jgi:predicted DNA-binding protein (MmcQ/YjbR family)
MPHGSCSKPESRAGSVASVAPTPIDRVRAVCLPLPEVEERPFGGHTAPAWRVRDKLFVMTGEDGTSMTCKCDRGVNAILVGDDPERFFLPKYVASKGWVGIRLGIDHDWDEIAELIKESYRLIAPKRLGALVDAPPAGG